MGLIFLSILELRRLRLREGKYFVRATWEVIVRSTGGQMEKRWKGVGQGQGRKVTGDRVKREAPAEGVWQLSITPEEGTSLMCPLWAPGKTWQPCLVFTTPSSGQSRLDPGWTSDPSHPKKEILSLKNLNWETPSLVPGACRLINSRVFKGRAEMYILEVHGMPCINHTGVFLQCFPTGSRLSLMPLHLHYPSARPGPSCFQASLPARNHTCLLENANASARAQLRPTSYRKPSLTSSGKLWCFSVYIQIGSSRILS